jgi:hypothetical protein
MYMSDIAIEGPLSNRMGHLIVTGSLSDTNRIICTLPSSLATSILKTGTAVHNFVTYITLYGSLEAQIGIYRQSERTCMALLV